MKNKYKVTGFTRLLIFMVLFTPIAYMGAHYYQGNDGWAELQSIFNKSKDVDASTEEAQLQLEIKKTEQELRDLRQRLEHLQKQDEG